MITDHYPVNDKIDLNTRFHSLDKHIWDIYHISDPEDNFNKWAGYLEENGYYDDAYKCEWDEDWLTDAIEFGRKLL